MPDRLLTMYHCSGGASVFEKQYAVPWSGAGGHGAQPQAGASLNVWSAGGLQARNLKVYSFLSWGEGNISIITAQGKGPCSTTLSGSTFAFLILGFLVCTMRKSN